MTMKKITMLYILFLTVIVLGFDSGLIPEPYELAKQAGPLAKLARQFTYRIPYDDKIAHFFLVGALAFCVNLSLSLASFTIGKRKVLKGSALLLIFVTLEETSQAFFPWRSCSLGDLAANYAGILCFGWAAKSLMAHKTELLPKLPRMLVPLFHSIDRQH